MLTAFIPQLSVFSFCLIAGKTKSVCAPSFDTNWSFKPCKTLLIQLRTLIPTPPHNHKKIPSQPPFPALSNHLQTAWVNSMLTSKSFIM